MANNSGVEPNGPEFPGASKFQEGRAISATQMQRIVRALTRRITGDGRTIRVNTFPNGQITIAAIRTGSIGSGGRADNVPRVGALPALPIRGKQEVFWDSGLSPNTGDNQIWHSYAGQSRWYPTTFTDKSGAPPGAEEDEEE